MQSYPYQPAPTPPVTRIVVGLEEYGQILTKAISSVLLALGIQDQQRFNTCYFNYYQDLVRQASECLEPDYKTYLELLRGGFDASHLLEAPLLGQRQDLMNALTNAYLEMGVGLYHVVRQAGLFTYSTILLDHAESRLAIFNCYMEPQHGDLSTQYDLHL